MPKKAFLGDDRPGFAIRLACKDVRLACEAAEQMGFEASVGRGAQATMDRAIAMGLGDRDTAALMFLREKQLGIEVRQSRNAWLLRSVRVRREHGVPAGGSSSAWVCGSP